MGVSDTPKALDIKAQGKLLASETRIGATLGSMVRQEPFAAAGKRKFSRSATQGGAAAPLTLGFGI
ncbi:MAG: hypothetical protein K8T25_00365 [Planctomycetia bacterium]|nr:hypothetical protein [Planctomycetia bacterium]